MFNKNVHTGQRRWRETTATGRRLVTFDHLDVCPDFIDVEIRAAEELNVAPKEHLSRWTDVRSQRSTELVDGETCDGDYSVAYALEWAQHLAGYRSLVRAFQLAITGCF